MTNVESMDYMHSYPSIIASLFGTVHCPFSHWELVQTSPVHPNPVIWYSFTHKPPYIFLKTATIPTYYGISIAIPRYIGMQLSTVPFIMTRSSLSYCFAWSCSWHRICGKATIHNFSYMSLLIHCISRYTAGGIHIESSFVLVSSCNLWVVNK